MSIASFSLLYGEAQVFESVADLTTNIKHGNTGIHDTAIRIGTGEHADHARMDFESEGTVK
jgi:hypothetical protein